MNFTENNGDTVQLSYLMRNNMKLQLLVERSANLTKLTYCAGNKEPTHREKLWQPTFQHTKHSEAASLQQYEGVCFYMLPT
jgi:hypothetical protein